MMMRSMLAGSSLWAYCLIITLGLASGQVLTSSNDTSQLPEDNELQLLLRTTQTGMTVVAQVAPLTPEAGLNQSVADLQVCKGRLRRIQDAMRFYGGPPWLDPLSLAFDADSPRRTCEFRVRWC